jgi:hypothetical protein
MTSVRTCGVDDVGAVADLFTRVFRRVDEPAPLSLRAYFVDVYFGNPWVDVTRPPLVAIDEDERVVGFLGAVPMPLRMRGRKLSAVIGGSFMVDPRHCDALAAVRLLKRFLNGSQDLALTDTANPVAIKFWQGLGGHAAHFQTMRWVLALRPATLGLALANRNNQLPLARGAAPLARVIDHVATRRLCPPSGTADLRSAPVPEVYEILDALGDESQLGFAGTLEEFEWLIDMTRRRTRYGPLQMLKLHNDTRTPIGAVIYFPNRGGIGQLALATARRGEHGTLLTALRRHAFEQGSVGIMGHADALLATELRHLPCAYIYRNDFTVVHAHDQSLLDPLLSGEVAMTRFTGEWWTRLQGDTFD